MVRWIIYPKLIQKDPKRLHVTTKGYTKSLLGSISFSFFGMLFSKDIVNLYQETSSCHSVLGECAHVAKIFDLLSEEIRQKLRFVRQITVRAPDIQTVTWLASDWPKYCENLCPFHWYKPVKSRGFTATPTIFRQSFGNSHSKNQNKTYFPHVVLFDFHV